jgi:enoyl-CoA hydratase/carnithine racemase
LAQFSIAKPAPRYWRVTFNNPPINLLNSQTTRELEEVVGAIENDEHLRVVVFDSGNPDFFLGRYDLSDTGGSPPTPSATGLPTFIDTTIRLSRASVVSIALIRGRTRGGGSEFALACDMRFASIEKALLGQPEVPGGLLPGGGAIERLPGLVGRARAIEIILSGDDFDAVTAERYGWVNRALPDTELDLFVDTLARRIASFDGEALSEAKRLINRESLPAPEAFTETLKVILEVASRPSSRERRARIRKLADEVGNDFEMRLGHYLGAET